MRSASASGHWPYAGRALADVPDGLRRTLNGGPVRPIGLCGAPDGYHAGMNEPASDRVQDRAAHLLPEELVAGSDDPQAQAEQILNDSDAREAFDESTPDLRIDHRQSTDTVGPVA